MPANELLFFALFIQVALLAGGLLFLFTVRHVIVPHSVWLAFVLNDVLWLLLIADQISHLSSHDLIGAQWTVVISFVITLLFLFRVVMRYRAHRQKMFLNAILLKREQELEHMRIDDEAHFGHRWDLIARMGFEVKPTAYRVNREARRD